MFQSHNPSYYGIDTMALVSGHPTLKATDLGDDSRMGIPHWITNPESQMMAENMHLLHAVSSNLTSPTTDDVFSFPSSTESSPHMSQLSMAGKDAEMPDSDEFMPNQKATVRRSQNRQAQRRFRERKEQQKTALLSTLDELQARHDKVADALDAKRQQNRTLETDKKRLEREVETLRKWRQKILGVMSDLVQEDRSADDLLTKVATSCSITCWRKGIQYSRTYIIMQTLLSLFEEFQGEDNNGHHGHEHAYAGRDSAGDSAGDGNTNIE
ncbi:hypothetical protein BJX99DRAFT_172272 [Aspergillus californicus]